MSKARLVITAVTIEKRPVSEVARTYGVARSWIYALLARYQAEGEAAFEPRSRRPRTSPAAISPDTADLIVRLRKELAGQGLDAGPHTIAWHLAQHHQVTVSAATISRYLARAGLVTPDPAKRPKSSCLRFEAEMPNQCWQSDFTHYPLADGTGTEILTWLDDYSRLALSVTAHPQTQGKVERFQQTLKKWLTRQPPPASLADLQDQLDTFTGICNDQRPHRSLPHRATPATAYAARPKAVPGDRTTDTHHRVRTDRVDANGKLTLRLGGRLHHIGIGRTHARTRVLMLIRDLDIRVINATTGELLRELVLDPTRDYQPTGAPKGPRTKHRDP